jgi:hypothetical protein
MGLVIIDFAKCRRLQRETKIPHSCLGGLERLPQPVAWKATAEVILDKVRRCKELAKTAHQFRCLCYELFLSSQASVVSRQSNSARIP